MSNETAFERLVKGTLSATQFEELKVLLGSPHMRTKLLAHPSEASNHQLLLFSQLLQMPAYQLYLEYGVGGKQVTELELAQHRRLYELQDKHSGASND